MHDAIKQDSEADREEKRKMMEMLQRFEEGADFSLEEDDAGLADALDGVDLGEFDLAPPCSVSRSLHESSSSTSEANDQMLSTRMSSSTSFRRHTEMPSSLLSGTRTLQPPRSC